MQAESAWRMGQWSQVGADGDVAPPEDAASEGHFNYAVLHMLRALSIGDRAGCQELLTCSRRVRSKA